MSAVQNSSFKSGWDELQKTLSTLPDLPSVKKSLVERVRGYEKEVQKWSVTPQNIEWMNSYNWARHKLGMERFSVPFFEIFDGLNRVEKKLMNCASHVTWSDITELDSMMIDLYNKHVSKLDQELEEEFYAKELYPRYERLRKEITVLEPRTSYTIIAINGFSYLLPILGAWQFISAWQLALDKVKLDTLDMQTLLKIPMILMEGVQGVLQYLAVMFGSEALKYVLLEKTGNHHQNPLHRPFEFSYELFQKAKITSMCTFGSYLFLPIFQYFWGNKLLLLSTSALSWMQIKKSLPSIAKAPTWSEKGGIFLSNAAIGAIKGAVIGFALQPVQMASHPLAASIAVPAIQNLVNYLGKNTLLGVSATAFSALNLYRGWKAIDQATTGQRKVALVLTNVFLGSVFGALGAKIGIESCL